MITSADHAERTTKIELLLEPQRGLTSTLYRVASTQAPDTNRSFLAFFSGPHGLPAPVAQYGMVLMVASGLGILSQLCYIREIIRGFNRMTSRTRRLQLVWQLEHLGKHSDLQCARQSTVTR